MARKSQPDAHEPAPVSFVAASNGEYAPRPAAARDRQMEKEFRTMTETRARKTGQSRRAFLSTSAATATALSVINQFAGCSSGNASSAKSNGSPSDDAGFYDVSDEATWDADAACVELGGNEFVFDVQVHHVDAFGAWRERTPAASEFGSTWPAAWPQAKCGEAESVLCFGVDHFIREVFVNSDTHIACLSGIPANEGQDPLDNSARLATEEIVNRLAGSQRLLVHASVFPERGEAELDAMQQFAENRAVAAWKAFPGSGRWRFTDEAIGIPFIERARRLGKRLICAHRGIAGDDGSDDAFSSPRDMGDAARAYPDVGFLAYHSGWEPGVVEGAYNSVTPKGVDRLIKTVLDNQLGKTGNFYAELGSLWRNLMTLPEQLAHVMGKLLLHVGEDRILWGTDCIWFGSPAEQIASFRAFQIPERMRAEFGYPELTPEAKRKILGLNAARVYAVDPQAIRCAIRGDAIDRLRGELRDAHAAFAPPSRPLGPRSRREFLGFQRMETALEPAVKSSSA